MQDSVSNKAKKKFFVGVNSGFVDEGQNPDERCIDFYSSRSGHGLYCTIVGNVVLPGGFSTNGKTARISRDLGWRRLAAAIRDKGSVPGIQFSSTWAGFKGERRFITRSHADTFDFYLKAGSQITQNEIATLITELSEASQIAIDHGFRHFQLHAAHGYFFNLAIHPLFSSYSDWTRVEIQGWINRMRKQGVETSIRLSMTTGWPEIDTEYVRGLSGVYDLDVDYIDLSDGFYNLDKRKIYPSTGDLSKRRFDLSVNVAAEYPGKTFILSGQAKYFSNALSENLHLGFCRDLIANPNFLINMEDGCTLCNKCHYFSRGTESLFCPHWEEPLVE